jgi:hypothetical protein
VASKVISHPATERTQRLAADRLELAAADRLIV